MLMIELKTDFFFCIVFQPFGLRRRSDFMGNQLDGATSFLYFLCRALGDFVRPHMDRMLNLARPRILMPSFSFLIIPLSWRISGSIFAPASNNCQGFDIHNRVFLAKDVVEAALGEAPMQGHLAALEAGRIEVPERDFCPLYHGSRSCCATADAAPDPLHLAVGAPCWF